MGLIFGAIGDVCLAIPGAFVAGMLAFAIGHGLYAKAFFLGSVACQFPCCFQY
ncbi:MAG: hypothetical protein IPP41_09620 [Rhodocyclaceae bacterium]|nr:hypothetical protein [Rhodocyclaceae bacterium]